ncbi:MAG: hypothetical protein JO262_14910 [Solirubrobacterales bacterium]|nr:hypothetical protein [Solirubrobacterales bacterium]
MTIPHAAAAATVTPQNAGALFGVAPPTTTALVPQNAGGYIGPGAPTAPGAPPQAVPNTPSDHWCTGWWRNRVANVYFYKSGGRLFWDFYLTPASWDWLGAEVYAEMPQAQLNGRAINPPYGPHNEPVTYDFHASIYRYNFLGGGGGTIKRGDYLWMYWEFLGSNPGHGAWRSVGCWIP